MKLIGTDIIAGWLIGIGASAAGNPYTCAYVSGDNRIRPRASIKPTEIEAMTPFAVVLFQNNTR